VLQKDKDFHESGKYFFVCTPLAQVFPRRPLPAHILGEQIVSAAINHSR
jgi:hypothetical protein